MSTLLDEELAKIQAELGSSYNTEQYNQAVALFKEVTLAEEYSEFLTTPAYVRFP